MTSQILESRGKLFDYNLGKQSKILGEKYRFSGYKRAKLPLEPLKLGAVKFTFFVPETFFKHKSKQIHFLTKISMFTQNVRYLTKMIFAENYDFRENYDILSKL